MKAGEEADFVGTRHFVGDAWEAVFCADYTVVCGVEVELDGLEVLVSRLSLISDSSDKVGGRVVEENVHKRSWRTYITYLGFRDFRPELVVCEPDLYGMCFRGG